MLKIFIADDDAIIRQGLRKIIEKKASECQIIGEAADGELTLEVLQKQNVDLLITDIKMPIMNGIELIKKINELHISVKIIVLSGFDEYKYVRESLKFGAVDYLLKPVQKNILLELIEKVKEDIENETINKQQNKLLHKKVEESIPLIKEKLLLNLIKGTYNSNCEKEIAEYTNCNAIIYIMALLCVDDDFKLDNRTNYTLDNSNAYILRNRLEQIAKKNNHDLSVLSTVHQSDIITLFMGEVKHEAFFEDAVTAVLSSLRTSIVDQGKFTFTSGVSKSFNTLEGTYNAYNQAVLASQRRFYEGKGKLIQYVYDNCCYKTAYERKFNEDISELMGFIGIGESSKVKRSIQSLLEKMWNENMEPEQFREMCSRIVSGVFSQSIEFSDASKDYYASSNYDIYFYIKELNTYEEVKEYISDSFFHITQRLNCIRAERSKKIIELAKDYIHKHFREEISLNSVAESVYLNQFYFSNLFKNETGKNFTDFLIDVRIKEAKKLLIRPDLKVYEIGQMVGYEEPVSFNRAFKRVVGISPAEYRKVIK